MVEDSSRAMAPQASGLCLPELDNWTPQKVGRIHVNDFRHSSHIQAVSMISHCNIVANIDKDRVLSGHDPESVSFHLLHRVIRVA